MSPSHSSPATCALCGGAVPNDRVAGEDGVVYCSTGCRDVQRVLGAKSIPVARRRHTDPRAGPALTMTLVNAKQTSTGSGPSHGSFST
jgi:hypothetical protein